MRIAVAGMGLWARGFTSAAALAAAPSGSVRAVDAGAAVDSPTATPPRPAAVDPKAMRRLPAPARLGVQVAIEACDAAGVATNRPTLVFCSALGDSAITDYMCATLAGEDKLLSPLKFQNSVHNAPAGCLSIATGNRHASSFVAAFDRSAALALLECTALLAAGTRHVLLVATDVPVPGSLADIHGTGELAGAALLLIRTDDRSDAAPAGVPLALDVGAARVDDTVATGERSSSVGELWPLLEAYARRRPLRAELPIGNASTLRLDLDAHEERHR